MGREVEADPPCQTLRLPHEPLLLYVDANRITQVLTNLQNNAARYTPRHGRVELSAEGLKRRVLVVDDNADALETLSRLVALKRRVV